MALPLHLQVTRSGKKVTLCEATGKSINLTKKKPDVQCKRCLGRLAKAENGAKPTKPKAKAGEAKPKVKAAAKAKPKAKAEVKPAAVEEDEALEELEFAEE